MNFTGGREITSGQATQTSLTPLCRLGTRAVDAAGRVYRYARANPTGGYFQPGAIYCANPGQTGGGQLQVDLPPGTITPQIAITGGAFPANTYAEGFLVGGSDGLGVAQAMQVASHPAFPGGTAAPLRVQLYRDDPIVYGPWTSAGPVAYLVRHPYADIQGSGSPQAVVGVGVSNAARGEYIWVQTWGPALVFCDATVTGGGLALTNNGLGTVAAAGQQVIGTSMYAQAGGTGLVFLTIGA